MPRSEWLAHLFPGEDDQDTIWPKKIIVGKQELDIHIGNKYIAFEVCQVALSHASVSLTDFFRQQKLAR